VVSPTATPGPAFAVIPAHDEETRIAATVEAISGSIAVETILVVDDGSTDNTTDAASAAGARVLRLGHNVGKGRAMELGVRHLWAGQKESDAEGVFLFLDADLQETAAQGEHLLSAVMDGSADMVIANLPEQATAGGGHGFVVTLARDGIEQATGRVMAQPLSGQRAITSAALHHAFPLAKGFGVEVGLTIDLLRAGCSVVEVPVDFHHRVTGRDWRSQVHRGRQYLSVWQALRERGVGPTLPLRQRGGQES
jgi:glycosyltransferase involved in cell wall biosynthesis